MSKDIEKTEKEVLKVYQMVNPSTFYIEEDQEKNAVRHAFMEKLFLHRLQFPPKMFRDAEVLELGSGTGENSLSYLRWGAHCTFVEVNNLACERAEKIFKRFAPDAKYLIENTSLFKFKTDKLFDVTISKGSLHHTGDVERAFDIQVKNLKPGGFAILGIGSSSGYFQRHLQRAILYSLAKNDEEMGTLANELFSEHIDRAEKIGGRARNAIIWDTYINPKYDPPSVPEVLRWFKKHNLKLYSSWPPIVPAVLGDSAGGALLEHEKFSKTLSLAEFIWLMHNEDDSVLLSRVEREVAGVADAFQNVVSEMRDIEPNSKPDFKRLKKRAAFLEGSSSELNPYKPYIKNFRALMSELIGLLELLEKKDVIAVRGYIKNARVLFRGTDGIGMNYYVGHRAT